MAHTSRLSTLTQLTNNIIHDASPGKGWELWNYKLLDVYLISYLFTFSYNATVIRPPECSLSLSLSLHQLSGYWITKHLQTGPSLGTGNWLNWVENLSGKHCSASIVRSGMRRNTNDLDGNYSVLQTVGEIYYTEAAAEGGWHLQQSF